MQLAYFTSEPSRPAQLGTVLLVHCIATIDLILVPSLFQLKTYLEHCGCYLMVGRKMSDRFARLVAAVLDHKGG
jgi:hypothetical protein